jgi:hypothetical protein
MAIQISGCTVIDNSRDSINIRVSCAQNFTYKVGACTQLATRVDGPLGGILICKASSVGWILAPISTEVFRTWYCRDDANTVAETITGCTGWFVPTITQLQNPGYCCRKYWDDTTGTGYWSSTECNAACGVRMDFSGFNPGTALTYCKDRCRTVRTFRCVTY